MDTIKSSNDTSDRVSSILDKLADSIIELAHLAKDEIQSVAAREGLENSMSIPSSHRESVSNVTFDDDIDDDMDDDIMQIDDNNKSGSSSRDRSKFSQGERVVPRIFFTKDQLDTFCSVVRCFMLTSSDEHRVADIIDILGFNINDPKSHFGDARCKAWVPVEVFFVILEHITITSKWHAAVLVLTKFFEATVKNTSEAEEDISIKMFKFLGTIACVLIITTSY